MKKHFLILMLIPFMGFAQELRLIKATKQIIIQGIYPGIHLYNYTIFIKKEKPFAWSIDSLCNVYTQQPVRYHIVKVDNPDAISPNYQQIKSFAKNDKGVFQITFSISTEEQNSIQDPPMNLQVPVFDFVQGAVIYYRAGKKRKQLLIESFEELETISAP